MKSISLLSAFFLLINFSISASTEKIKIKYETSSKSSVFLNTNLEAKTYEQSSASGTIEMSIRGSGPLRRINSRQNKPIDTVPGINYEGHSKVKIQKQGEKFYIGVDLLIDDTIEGAYLNVRSQFNAEMTLVEGTWEAYENGEDVVFELTDEGQEIANEAGLKAIRQTLKAVTDQLQTVLPSVGELSVRRYRNRGNSKVKANLSKVELIEGRSKAEFQIDVEL